MSIYLDYNASTPIDPAVAEAMRPFLDEAFGNPSSGQWVSARAKAALDRARERVAALLGAAPEEIVFTSGGSEANNLAIKGTYFAGKHGEAHVITSTIEHPAILAPCQFLERLGGSVTYLPVDRTGLIDPEDVRRAITPQTLLISIMQSPQTDESAASTIFDTAPSFSRLMVFSSVASDSYPRSIPPWDGVDYQYFSMIANTDTEADASTGALIDCLRDHRQFEPFSQGMPFSGPNSLSM